MAHCLLFLMQQGMTLTSLVVTRAPCHLLGSDPTVNYPATASSAFNSWLDVEIGTATSTLQNGVATLSGVGSTFAITALVTVGTSTISGAEVLHQDILKVVLPQLDGNANTTASPGVNLLAPVHCLAQAIDSYCGTICANTISGLGSVSPVYTELVVS